MIELVSPQRRSTTVQRRSYTSVRAVRPSGPLGLRGLCVAVALAVPVLPRPGIAASQAAAPHGRPWVVTTRVATSRLSKRKRHINCNRQGPHNMHTFRQIPTPDHDPMSSKLFAGNNSDEVRAVGLEPTT
jgi:hypothetical protein